MSFGLLGVIVFLAIILGLFLLPAVQTVVAKNVLTYFLEEDNVELNLERIAITPFSAVEISGLYLSDQEKDTLLFINSLKVYVDDWTVSPFELKFDTVILDNSKFYMSVQNGDSLSNLQFVIDRFSIDSKDTSNMDYHLDFGAVRLNGVFFHWDDFNQPNDSDTSLG